MSNVTIFGDWADDYDARVAYSERLLDDWVDDSGYSVTSMVVASTAKAFMTFSQGFVDLGRFGNGILIEGGWKGVGKDLLRGVTVIGGAGAVLGRLGRALQVTQKGATCAWTSLSNSLRWSGQRFLASVDDLAQAAGINVSQIASLGRAAQITRLQQALTKLGIPFRILQPTQKTAEAALALVRANPGGVVNFSLRLLKAGKDVGGHRLYAVFTRTGGLVIRDPNFPHKVIRTLAALRAHVKAAYAVDDLVLSNSPAVFIKNAWIVMASHLAQRGAELAQIATQLSPIIGVTAPDAPTARQVIAVKRQTIAGCRPSAIASHTVARGDRLWDISGRYYGEPKKWPVIYAANSRLIGKNPDLIRPGQVLCIPRLQG